MIYLTIIYVNNSMLIYPIHCTGVSYELKFHTNSYTYAGSDAEVQIVLYGMSK